MRKAAVSIVSFIAEGSCRRTRKDYLHFLGMSYASGAEVETQIEVSKRLPKTKNLNYLGVDGLLEEVMKMLNKLVGNLSKG